MNLIGNILWIIFGGLLAALGYTFGGFILCVTIIGFPWGLQCFKLAGIALLPFGKNVISESSRSGCFSLFANIVWILCGGLYTALNHLFWAILLALTIVGIPFAKQHLKLLEISLMPFGKRIVYGGTGKGHNN